jgi:hypothetical protein
LIAAQSPLAQSTTEFAAVVVKVADGAPVPATETVAGDAASLALVNLFKLIEAFCCVPDDLADVAVEAVPPAVTVATHKPIHVCPPAEYDALSANVAVEPVIVGVA